MKPLQHQYQKKYACNTCGKKLWGRDADYSLETFGVIACSQHLPETTVTGFKHLWNK